jgi:hypothetical protein
MSYPDLDGVSRDSSRDGAAGSAIDSAEETLRLIARLPAPGGLEERVKAGLRAAPQFAPPMGRVLAWPSPMAGGWLRAAAAAAIVFVVAGGGWGIYSRVQPGQPAKGIGGTRMAAPGGFTEGGAVRRPQTLTGPVVPGPVVTGPAVKAPAPNAAPKTKKSAAASTMNGQPAAANNANAKPAAAVTQ